MFNQDPGSDRSLTQPNTDNSLETAKIIFNEQRQSRSTKVVF